MSVRLKYLCLRSHLNGRYFRKGVVYMFAIAPAGDYAAMFREGDEGGRQKVVSRGTIDLDNTYYPLDGDVGYTDMRFAASRLRQGATQKPDYDPTELGLLMPQNDATEILYINDQFPHEMVTGGIILPHVHWMQTAADQVPVFKIDSRFYQNDWPVPVGFDTAATVAQAFDYDGSGRMAQISLFPNIDLSALGIATTSALFDIKLYRDDNTVTGDVLLKTFDLHIPIDAPMGSGQEFIK